MGILTDGGYITIIWLTLILVKNDTSESLVTSILTCFKESGSLLNDWRSVMIEFILENARLVDLIPSAGEWT
jgi:hypothetical protein